MHYYIDGYNLLFRLIYHGESLQRQREQIIDELNRKIALVKIEVSIVFDAAFQAGERTRSHYDHLEILFTAQGETADEYILDEIKNSSSPRQETVVTSDKKLAWIIRRCSAHTESVEDFMQWLDKAHKNQLKQLKKSDSPAPFPSPTLSKSRSLITPPSIESLFKASTDERTNYYEAIFEKRFEEFLEDEEKARCKKKEKSPPKRMPSKKASSSHPLSSPSKPISNMDRWLKAFEERFQHPNDFDSKY